MLSVVSTITSTTSIPLRGSLPVSPHGNGLVLTAPAGAQAIQIVKSGGSEAARAWAWFQRVRSACRARQLAPTLSSLLGYQWHRVEGTYTTLMRLETAIRDGNTIDMERLVNRSMMIFVGSAWLGGWSGSTAVDRTDSNTNRRPADTAQEVESNEIDADLASVISELTTRQAAYQASLQLMGSSSQTVTIQLSLCPPRLALPLLSRLIHYGYHPGKREKRIVPCLPFLIWMPRETPAWSMWGTSR